MSEAFSLKKSVIFTETDYGAALLDDRTGQYWQLNATSAAIVSDLRSGMDTDAVVRRLVERFEGVDHDTAMNDVHTVVEQLKTVGIAQ